MGHKALVLCAGFGTRMGSWTKTTPKPMLTFSFDGIQKPMLELTLHNLKRCGIDEVAINLHYLPDQITGHLQSLKHLNMGITYSYEDQPLGTAGAVKLLGDYFKTEENFFVIYGDILTDLDYSQLMAFHVSHGKKASIVLHQRKQSNSYVELDQDQKITSFIERPKNMPAEFVDKDYWVNSAIYCFHNSILEHIPSNTVCDFPRDIFPELVTKQQLYGFPLAGAYRIAIDSEARYFKAQADINEHKIKWEAIYR